MTNHIHCFGSFVCQSHLGKRINLLAIPMGRPIIFVISVWCLHVSCFLHLMIKSEVNSAGK